MTSSDNEYDALLWHDNCFYGFAIEIGDIERGDWRADLVLDIDHILEWVKTDEAGMRFRVAPATLTFHDVTEVRLALDWGTSGHQTAVHEGVIDRIDRTQVSGQKICLDRPYYRWNVVFNVPKEGWLALGASGYSLDLRREPVLMDEQRVPPGKRITAGMTGRDG